MHRSITVGMFIIRLMGLLTLMALFPYIAFGITILRIFPPHQAVYNWASDILKGHYGIEEILAAWPQYSADVWHGILVSWGISGGLVVAALSGMLLLAPFVALLECRCGKKDEEEDGHVSHV